MVSQGYFSVACISFSNFVVSLRLSLLLFLFIIYSSDLFSLFYKVVDRYGPVQWRLQLFHQPSEKWILSYAALLSWQFRGYSSNPKKEDRFPLLLTGDFVEGELNPVANKNVSHLAEYLYYTFENITSKVAVEMDKLGLEERYNRALKAS